jgi:tripartite-type tricarboxylate transporter receptor subunit TctC
MWKMLLCVSLACFSCEAAAADAKAEPYPSKPIRLIDGFSPGGGSDFLARVIGPRLTERLGQPVIVDNRPGVAGGLAAGIVARAAPDGYTLHIIVTIAFAPTPSLYPKLAFDPMKDFSYISRVATSTYLLLTNPSVPVKSVSELVTFARSQSKSVSYGSNGETGPSHLTMALLQNSTGMNLLHVPYRSAPAVIVAMTAGEVQIGTASLMAAMPMVSSKKLNVLAVTASKRIAALPNVPTMAESGINGYDVTPTFGILAPGGMPPDLVKLLNTEIRRVVETPDFREKVAAQGTEAAGSTPDEFKSIVQAEIVKWARLIKAAHIKAPAQ